MSTEKPTRAPRYITPEGFRRIAEEHERIWTVSRPRVLAEVAAAAAHGDRSDNAEYLYGKKKLRELDRRLRELSERMDSLTVVAPKPHPSRRAYFALLGKRVGDVVVVQRPVGRTEVTVVAIGWESPA
jgi:transcription elongation factor GreB